MRLIDADALLKAMEEERQYLLARGQTGAEHIIVHHCLPIIDNAPTVEPRIEFGTDGQPYRLFMSGGQVVPDTLHGWRYEERPQGEWKHWGSPFSDEQVANSIVCSVCGARFVEIQDEVFNFCPNCGAKMKGGNKNE